MRAICALLSAASLAAQGPVRVVSTMRDDVVATVREHVEATVVDVPIEWTRIDEAELAHRYAGGMEVDVVCGVDAQLCEIAAAYGRLERTAADHDGMLYADGAGRYHVPWATAWVNVWIEGGVEPPDTFDEIIDGRYDDRVILPSPNAAPTLWVGWMREVGELRNPSELFSWFHTLDGRVAKYQPTIGHAVAALSRGEGAFAMLPIDVALELRARNGDGSVRWKPLGGVVPLGAYGVALARDSYRPEAARRVFDALHDVALARALSERHGLFTFAGGPYGDPLDVLEPRVRAFEPLPAQTALDWLDRFDATIRGRGRDYEITGVIIDIVMTIGFFVTVWFVFRSIKGDEEAKPDAAA